MQSVSQLLAISALAMSRPICQRRLVQQGHVYLPRRKAFLSLGQSMERVCESWFVCTSRAANGAVQGPQPGVQGLILELLCFCVVHHGYRMKYFVLGNNLLPKASLTASACGGHCSQCMSRYDCS